MCEVVGAGVGYILAPDQLLQADVPTANIVAVYSAIGVRMSSL
jgi:hypothetical protein